MTDYSFIPVLASSGDSGYLYGLFFLIISLIIGAATRHFLQRIPLPFTVLLLLIGLGLGGLNRAYGPHGGHAHSGDHVAGEVHGIWDKFIDTLSGAISWGGNLDGHLILYVFLPILIFEAGFALDVHTFKKSFLNAFYLAGPGIVTATVMTGLAFMGLIAAFGGSGGVLEDWNVDSGAFIVLASMLFGAVVSATDPVAVVALLKELGASKKLGTLIEGESLLNDGTAIVAFVLLIGVVTGAEQFLGTGSFIGSAAIGFGKIGAAGGLVGVLIGLLAIVWVRKVFNDPLIEITVVLVTAYAVFFVCEHFFHVSGVLGLVALGIVMAGVGRTRISPEVEHFMHEFWEFTAFAANVIIFIVVGVVIAQKAHPTGMDFLILFLVYVAIHLVRGINMGMFYPLMKKAGYGLPGKDAVVVWWGALRGAIGLALALVVYSENLRYEFEIDDGGSGYSSKTTSIFVVDAKEALSYSQPNPSLNLYGMAANSFAQAQISNGRIVGISQSPETAGIILGKKNSKDASQLREDLASGAKKVVIFGEGQGAIAQASLVGISARVRDQFLFLISGIVLLTLLVNATTIKTLVNKLGLTELPAVKKLMFSNATGNISNVCELEMDLLKDDRFLSGANWGLVRNYLPEPVSYPLTARELESMDTLAEARRRLLEKERSSYWSQFRSGLLSARAVAQLDNNLSEFLDFQGKVPMTERSYLDDICTVSKLSEALKDIPFLKRYFSDKITVGYDASKAFVIAQQAMAKMVDSFVRELDDSGDLDKQQKTARLLKDEIRQNRLRGLQYIRNMHENYPEVTVGIETKDAIRSVLNHERASIKKMRGDGMLEADEASRMITAVEERMKNIMESPLELRLPSAEEVLREVTWLKGMDDEVISKILNASETRVYNSGDALMKQGDSGDGLIVITRGSVKVSIGDVVVDIMGRGAVIGEMAVLAGVPRTATVNADSTVNALWLNTDSMQAIMSDSPELSGSLWKTASMRFAENLLGAKDPYNGWSQIQLRRWLNEGDVIAPSDGETTNLYGKVAVLVSGQAIPAGSTEPINAPAHLDLAEATFNGNAKVYIRNA
ncbi:MAG: cation:proton antiporter [Verrucomicrobia bacterium]|nr:cation:proton antiporter [Verrucomicrobiota bacterium]